MNTQRIDGPNPNHNPYRGYGKTRMLQAAAEQLIEDAIKNRPQPAWPTKKRFKQRKTK